MFIYKKLNIVKYMLTSVRLTLNSSRSEIVKIFTDPFRLSGVISHFVVLQAYDDNLGRFVSPSQALKDKIPNLYKVLYVFGTPDTGIKTLIGTLKGPEIITGGVQYKGKDDENTFEFNIQIMSQEMNSKTSVTIITNLVYHPTMKHKIFGKEIKELKEQFNFPEHIVKEHIVPYLHLTYKLEEVVYLQSE